jgi:hypothetical protein
VKSRGVSVLDFVFDIYSNGGMEQRAVDLMEFMANYSDEVAPNIPFLFLIYSFTECDSTRTDQFVGEREKILET